jgi:hypothetical protein
MNMATVSDEKPVERRRQGKLMRVKDGVADEVKMNVAETADRRSTRAKRKGAGAEAGGIELSTTTQRMVDQRCDLIRRVEVWTEDWQHSPIFTSVTMSKRGRPTLQILEGAPSKAKLFEIFRERTEMERSNGPAKDCTDEEILESLQVYLIPGGTRITDDLIPKAIQNNDKLLVRGIIKSSNKNLEARKRAASFFKEQEKPAVAVGVQFKIMAIRNIETVNMIFYADFIVIVEWELPFMKDIKERMIDWVSGLQVQLWIEIHTLTDLFLSLCSLGT